ncbi:MAG: response regulator transcription factor [Chloroflexi bacterium]|nr:response regulator transcription factor [Chloroflexota bacterium]
MTTDKITLLLIEDDHMIAEPLLFGLEGEGFRTLYASNGHEGLALIREEKPDLILLDVMLPGIDGFQLLRQIRRESVAPVIMVTARDQEMDRVMGLESGADDYIVKPFSFRELLARVRATLRRIQIERQNAAPQPKQIEIGPISLDVEAHLARRNGKPLDLTEKEFALLEALMTRAGSAVHRHQLLDLVWGEGWIGSPRTLDVHIRWLREKLEENPSKPKLILTVRGYGYRFASPDELAQTT